MEQNGFIKLYFAKDANGQIIFDMSKQSKWVKLTYHNTYVIKPHEKVQHEKSPYDGGQMYKNPRLKDYSYGLMSKNAKILHRRQKGHCALYDLPLEHLEVIEIDIIHLGKKEAKTITVMVD